MRNNASPSALPSIVLNKTNLTELYFSPNVTVIYNIDQSKKLTPSYTPYPSILIVKPSTEIIKNKDLIITPIQTPSRTPTKTPTQTPTSSPIRNLRGGESKDNYIHFIFYGFIILFLIVIFCFCLYNRLMRINSKKKVDIRVPLIIPQEGAIATPPNSGSKSPRFIIVHKDCDV
jgi:hypothetical protein